MPSLKIVQALTLCPCFKGNSKLATPVLCQQKNNTYAGANKHDDVVLGTPIEHPATTAANAANNEEHDNAKHPVSLPATKVRLFYAQQTNF